MIVPAVQLQVGERLLPLARGSAIDLPPDTAVTGVRATLRCSRCGGSLGVTAAPVAVAHDDDHFAYVDVFYESVHEASCAGCGAPLRLRLGHCTTMRWGDRALRIERSGMVAAQGCTLDEE